MLTSSVISCTRYRVHLHYHLQSCYKDCESRWSNGDCKSCDCKNTSAAKWKACRAIENVISHAAWFKISGDALWSDYLLLFSKYLSVSFLYSLINLYNLLETPYCQFYVYMKTLNLAVDGKVTEFIIPSFKKIDNFLKDWKIGIPEQRELFLAISNILKENKRYSSQFYFCSLYLSSEWEYYLGFFPWDCSPMQQQFSIHLSVFLPFFFQTCN